MSGLLRTKRGLRRLSQVKAFGEALKDKLNQHDSIDRFKLFRIYRDIRFSKDKTPFKPISA